MGSGTPKHFIGLRHLLVKHAELSAMQPGKISVATLNTTIALITHWMGREWVLRTMSPVKGHPLLRLKGGAEDQIEKLLILRLRTFAEDLFNLQYIEGFHALIERLKTREVESSWAELQVARLLYMHDMDFKFVTPGGNAGEDYDIEIRVPGHIICGETKCKVSSSTPNVKSLANDLKKATRTQLPKDKPGIVFVALPQSWFDTADDPVAVELKTVEAAEMALRSTSRLVSVILYSSRLHHDGTEAIEVVLHKEVPNPAHRFPEFPNGELLRYRPSGRYWDQMPPQWLRLYDLPYGALGEYRHEEE